MSQFHNPHSIPPRYLATGGAEKLRTLDARLLEFGASWTGLQGMVLLGPTGCGKSLAAALAGARVRASNSNTWVKWIRADKLSRCLSVRGGAEEIESLEAGRVLIIDELGYERWPELVLEVIGARHDGNLPTVVTSGLKLDALQDRYGDATVRRIVETGAGKVINCWEKSHAAS